VDDNKNVKESSDNLLDLLSRYSDETRTEAEGASVADKKENAATVSAFSPAGALEGDEEEQPSSHYSDEVGLDGVVRPAPEGGHLSDDEGNSVELNAKKDEADDAFASVHFSGTEEAKAKARKAYKRAKRRNRPKKRSGSVTVSVIKGLAYTAVVCLLAFFAVFGFFDYWPGIIPMANDVFAFTKSGGDITVDIGSDMTTEEVAALLEKNGVIEEEKVFKFYVKYKFDESVELDSDDLVGSMFHLMSEFCKTMFFGGDIDPEYELDYLVGTHTLTPDMNYDQIILALTTTDYIREEVTVTVPEGYTTDQIISLLVNNGIGTKEGYISAINEYPYKHEFVQLLNEEKWAEGRIYRLDGYLYPDTYLFYKDTSEVEVINKMLNNFSARIWAEYYSTYKPACEQLGFTFDQMVAFASIVQAEGKSFSDFENVSQVFHNRFASKEFDKLESCATVQYAMDCDNIKNGLPVNRKPVLDDQDIKYETPYNTYLYKGLPPGAICNPGLDAIEAALYPDMSDEIKKEFGITKAYYFNSDLTGKIYYAQTPYQHSVNKQKADAVNKKVLDGTYVGD